METLEKSHSDSRRPVAVTVLAWFLIVGAALFLVMKPLTWSSFPLERNLWNISSKLLAGLCGVGFLLMRKWAVVLYFAMFVVNTVLIFAWPPTEDAVEQYYQPHVFALLLIVPGIVALITFPKWRLMKW